MSTTTCSLTPRCRGSSCSMPACCSAARAAAASGCPSWPAATAVGRRTAVRTAAKSSSPHADFAATQSADYISSTVESARREVTPGSPAHYFLSVVATKSGTQRPAQQREREVGGVLRSPTTRRAPLRPSGSDGAMRRRARRRGGSAARSLGSAGRGSARRRRPSCLAGGWEAVGPWLDSIEMRFLNELDALVSRNCDMAHYYLNLRGDPPNAHSTAAQVKRTKRITFNEHASD